MEFVLITSVLLTLTAGCGFVSMRRRRAYQEVAAEAARDSEVLFQRVAKLPVLPATPVSICLADRLGAGPQWMDVMKLSRSDGPDMVKGRYIRLARIYYPDNSETGDVVAFQKLQRAYEQYARETRL